MWRISHRWLIFFLMKETHSHLRSNHYILKALRWIGLLNKLLELSIYPLLSRRALWFIFSSRFSLRLLWKQIWYVISQYLNLLAYAILRSMQFRFLYRIVDTLSTSTWVFVIKRKVTVLVYIWNYSWMVYLFQILSVLSTFILREVFIKAFTGSVWS